MHAAFWLAIGLVVYVYVGYPAVLAVWARLRPRPWRRSMTLTPRVSVILAARNEAARLPGRIDNLLALDYPADSLEIIVVSDGSSDRTADALAPYTGERRGRRMPSPARPRVRLIECEAAGKAAALNRGVEAAYGEILVFADARQRFARDAVRRLVANFADRSVGAASGELVLDCEFDATTSTVAESVGAYWRYEKWLRSRESLVDSTLGATGAIYAMRRAAWRALPRGTILDDVLAPMRVVQSGWRVVFDASARAFDVTAPDASAELTRKTRTLAGNWQMLRLAPQLLVPGINRTWFQYWSHKVGRLLVPFALATALVTSLALVQHSSIFVLVLAAQAVFYALAMYGYKLERQRAAATSRAMGPAAERPERNAVNA